jgi:hypothetical protein
MIDLTKADSVEFVVDTKGKVWVNINGQCALRVQHAKLVELDEWGAVNKVLYKETV